MWQGNGLCVDKFSASINGDIFLESTYWRMLGHAKSNAGRFTMLGASGDFVPMLLPLNLTRAHLNSDVDPEDMVSRHIWITKSTM